MTRTTGTARNLTAEGYKFFPTPANPFLFTVVKPSGNTYRVNLCEGTCDCIAGKRGVSCCHKKECGRRAAAQMIRPGFASREAFESARAADFAN